jgi:hypothetical protein
MAAALPAFACGDDDGSTQATATASDADPGLGTPIVTGPVSQFSVLVEEVPGGGNLVVHNDRTFVLTADVYAKTTAFANEAEGKKTLTDWGYREGYETAISPEGGNDAILNGGFVVLQEIHMFATAAGAEAAFQFFREKVATNGISIELRTVSVGDESFATQTVSGKIGAGSANVDRVLHQVLMRRGNIVAVVMTVGAGPVMNVEPAGELATIVDEKIRGQREHPTPTPGPAQTAASRTASP